MVCRGNYSLTSYDPPLLYDVNSDPGEIYDLSPTQYQSVLQQIDKVCRGMEGGRERRR